MADEDDEDVLLRGNIATITEERNYYLEQIEILKAQLLEAGITPFCSHSKSTPNLAQNKRFSLPNPKKSDDDSVIKTRKISCFENNAKSKVSIPEICETKQTLSTYFKRSGTSDLGKQYEYVMCAYYAIRFATSDDVSDFEMTTNHEIYGDFDDIALTVRYVDGNCHKYLLQLKHTENKKGLTEKNLAAEKNDFSLMKYLKTFQNLQDRENLSCILFSNRTAYFKELSQFTMNNIDIVVKEYQKIDYEELLDTNQTRKQSVFQFDITENSEKAENMRMFLKQFYLFSNQNNVSKMKALIIEHLKQLLQCDVYDIFIHFMKNWWCGNFVLTKTDVIAKLAEVALSPSIRNISHNKCTENSEILRKAILKFDMTLIDGIDTDVISQIWLTNEELREVSLTALKYGLTNKGISCLEELTPEQRSKALWYLNKVPLIVKVYDSRREQVICAIRLLSRIEKKKLVILGDFSKDEFSSWKIFENLSDLEDDDLYDLIIKNFEISLQGRFSVTLETVIDTRQKASIIKVRELFMMTQNPLLVGNKKISLPESYIPRTVYTNFLNTEKVLEKCNNDNELVIIKCDQEYHQIFEHKNITNIELSDYEGESEILIFLTEKCTKAQFDNICRKTTKRRVHLLQILNDQSCFLVLSSDNALKSEVLKYNRKSIEEKEIHRVFDNPINVLCAQPGIGKSTMIKYLDNNCPPDHWSVCVNLRKFNSLLKEEPEEEEILLHFLEVDQVTHRTLLDEIKLIFVENRKIYVFLDGLDEIESNCVDFALDYVNYIAATGVHVWISSRQNLLEVITTRLNVFPIDIKELNQTEQTTYIQQRLEGSYDQEEIEKISKEIFRSADVGNSHNILGIPLQLFIITENFLDDVDLYNTLSEEIFVLTKMYKIFFDGKKKHLYEKVGVQYDQQLGFNFNLHLENYEIPALKCCLDDNTFQRLNLETDSKTLDFLEMIKNEGDKFGIISQINDDRAVFTHQTYAEYFACLWLRKNFSKSRFLKDEFMTEKYQNLKLIFDIMLAENCPLHLAVIYRNEDQVRKHLTNICSKDEGGRTALHLVSSYGNKYFALRLEPSLYSNDLFHDENHFNGENIKFREIFAHLSQCDAFVSDEVFQWNSLDYAFHFQCLYPVEKFLEQYDDKVKIDFLLGKMNAISLAYYSAKLGYPNLLEAIIKKNSHVINFRIGEDRLSFLHVAVKGISDEADVPRIKDSTKIKIIKILIKNGIDINVKDKNGATPLHWAVTRGQYNIVKALLDESADINAITSKEETVIHYALQEWENDVKFFNTEKFDITDKNGLTLLHWACKESDFELVKTILKNGVKINERNKIGENALHYTVRAWKPNLSIIKLLIDNNIDINCADNFGITPLHWAFKNGSYDVIGLLHQNGANVTSITSEHKNTLNNCYTPHKPNMHVMEMLMDYGFNVNVRSFDGTSILHWVSEKGHIGLINLLIANGANINAVTKNLETILHYASRGWNTKIIKMFTEIGIDVNCKDINGTTGLHRAAECGNLEMVKSLVQEDANISAINNHAENILTFAVKTHEPQIDLVKFLIKEGIDVNSKDQDGVTPLHWACERGYLEIVKLLLDEGAKVNSLTQKGESPLHYANPNPKLINMLLQNGVNVNASDVKGMTALHWASERGQIDLVRILVECDANVNATTTEEETVLIYTVKRRKINIELVKLLVIKGADISAIDKNGMNALHWASESGHYDVVKLLLEKGVDVNSRTNKKETTLHYASKSWQPNTEVIKRLLTAGVDINAQDGDGATALHWACKEGHYMNVEILVDSKADVFSKTKHCETTLHFASKAWKINDSVLELLIDQGVDVNSVDNEGKSALHYASEKGFYNNVLLLLDRGAVVDDITFTNLTALHFAVYGGHVRIIKLLLQKGLNINKIETRNVSLPLYFAERNGHLKEDLLVMMAATIHDKFPLLSWTRYSYQDVFKYLQEAQPYLEPPVTMMRNVSTSVSDASFSRNFLSSCQNVFADSIGHSGVWLRNLLNSIVCRKGTKNPQRPTFIVHYPVFSTDVYHEEEVKTPTIDRSFTF